MAVNRDTRQSVSTCSIKTQPHLSTVTWREKSSCFGDRSQLTCCPLDMVSNVFLSVQNCITKYLRLSLNINLEMKGDWLVYIIVHLIKQGKPSKEIHKKSETFETLFREREWQKKKKKAGPSQRRRYWRRDRGVAN